MSQTLAALFFRNRKTYRPRPASHMDGYRLGNGLAWFLALICYVASNLSEMLAGGYDLGPFGALLWHLQGQGIAALMMLAGLKLGQEAYRDGQAPPPQRIAVWAGILMLVGLTASIFHPGDVLRYGAGILLAGALFVRVPDGVRWAAMLLLCGLYLILLQEPYFDSQYRWATAWEGPLGFILHFMRDLLFIGWYPLVPWLVFFLLGLSLAGRDLSAPAAAPRLLALGTGLGVVAFGVRQWVQQSAAEGPGLVAPIGSLPLPMEPTFLLSGVAGACLLLGICLLTANRWSTSGLVCMAARAGGQCLTLYLMHIILARVGWWSYEAAWGHSPFLSSAQILVLTLLFLLGAVIYSDIWARYFRHGPLEALLRIKP